MSDDDLRRQLDALDEPGEEQQVPSWANSPLVKQLDQDGTIESLTMRHRVQQDADRLEAIAKSRDHMGTMGKSWGILPDSDPNEAGLLEQAGNMLLGTARTKKEWADREAKEIEADRGRVKQVEETTQRGAATISRLFGAGVGEQIAGGNVGTFGARQAERAETPEGRGERAIAKREGTLARIQSGEDKGPMKTGLRSGVESFATGAIEALPTAAAKTIGIAYGYAARVVGSESPPDENLAYALGNWISAKGKELFPGDPRRQEEFTQKLSQGAGSMLGFMGPAVTARLLGASNDVLIKLAAIGGATAEGAEIFEDASHSMKERPGEVTEWHRFAAWVAGLGLGVTEAAPIATLLKRRGGTYSGAIGREALEEGGQEMLQSLGEDYTAQKLHDPSRQIGENALEAGAIGAILGGTIQGGRLAASRSARQQIRDEREPDAAAKAQPAPEITQTPDLSAMAERQPRAGGEARSKPTQSAALAETLPPDIAEIVRKAAPDVAAKHGIAPSTEPDQQSEAETVSNPEQASATEGKPQQVEAEQPKSPEVTSTDVKSPDIEQLRAQLDKVNRKAKLAAVAEEMGLGLTDAQLGGKLTDIRAAILQAVEVRTRRADARTSARASVRREAKPQSLVEFVRARGGINDVGGNLAAMDARRRPGLINRRGLDPDRMRELAVEAGYLQEGADGEQAVTTADDLIEAIRDELGGRKVYSAVDVDRVAELKGQEVADQQAEVLAIYTEEMLQWHEALDIPFAMTQAEIERAASLMASGLDIDSAIERVQIETINELSDETQRGRAPQDGKRSAGEGGDIPFFDGEATAGDARATVGSSGQARQQEELGRQFREILRGTTSAKTWAKQLGITDAEMKPLVDRAVKAGLLRVSKDGIIRRTPKAKQQVDDASGRDEGLERDWRDGPPQDGLGEAGVPASGRDDADGAGGRGIAADGSGFRSDGVSGVSTGDATATGAGRDSAVQGESSGDVGSSPGDRRRGRGRAAGEPGVPVGRLPEATVANAAPAASPLAQAIEAQQRADATVKFVANDPENIRASLPLLKPAQQDDVIKAEARFSKRGGHGFLFTNGTGTGKTFTGLGVIKRFAAQGKTNVLIVAPSQGILDGWVASGRMIGLDITRLPDTGTAGTGIVATTYANLRANAALADRQWDLLVADEAHNLSQNASGNPSDALGAFRGLSGKTPWQKARLKLIAESEELMRLKEAAQTDQAAREEHKRKSDEYHEKLKALTDQFAKEPRAKALFLSATPFAYRKNTDWGDGFLFDYPEEKSGYNNRGGQSEFLVTNFGYNMRYGRAEEPGPEVNVSVLEREFYERLKRDGVLSGRRLEVEADYDRRFVLVDDAVGAKIDQAMDWLNTEANGRYRPLADAIREKFDYLAQRRLLEAIKAKHVIPRIKKDLELGRKVVVFHDYNEGGGINAFGMPDNPNERVRAPYGETGPTIGELYGEFIRANPYVTKLNFAQFTSPIETLTRAFPQAMVYNGRVPNKQRAKARDEFNRDGSGRDIIIVQSAAGEAGISLHDTTGKHQRVLYNLGLPTRPTTAIQQEGRIYREGQVSDAILRYMSTGTGWERKAFAQTIAERASTAENLALGEDARALRDAFINAFNDADTIEQGADEGKGGKSADRAEASTLTQFEKAKAFYFGEAKKKGRRDQREGKDYYATPEPIGLKMVEFADVAFGEKVLEPSAGHGAISRWFPEGAERTLIEPSPTLASRASLSAPGAKVIESTFEDHYVGNKYDAIVMNPPFGVGGKDAFEHIQKAAQHLRMGGRIVAIVLRGGAADARFEKFQNAPENKQIYVAGDIAMPPVMFERAGTKVATRILVLERHADPANAPQQVTRDLSNAETIGALFDRIEDLSFGKRRRGEQTAPRAPRQDAQRVDPTLAQQTIDEPQTALEAMLATEPAPQQPQQPPPTQGEIVGGTRFKAGETVHGKTGEKLFVASMADYVSRDTYEKLRSVAKKYGGYYSTFRGAGAIPGFQFRSEESRQAFVDDARLATGGRRDQPRQPGPMMSLAGPMQRAEASADASTGRSMRRDLDALGYFSQALEAAKGLKQAKGTPEQMLAQLRAAGVKQAEIEATKLSELMAGKPSITRDEIVAHLEGNRVGLNEVTRGGTPEVLEAEAQRNFGRSYNDLSPRDQRDIGYLVGHLDASTATKWSADSLDPSNPTYRETVLHLPDVVGNSPDLIDIAESDGGFILVTQNGRRLDGRTFTDVAAARQAMIDAQVVAIRQNRRIGDPVNVFRSDHFPEPNIVGHMMTSMVKHKGRPTYLIDQIQSDWGQKLRDGGVRDEAKIAEWRKRLDARLRLYENTVASDITPMFEAAGMTPPKQANHAIADLRKAARDFDELGDSEAAGRFREQERRLLSMQRPIEMIGAELKTLEASTPGHPLVNTTDQWVNTTLRRALRQAIEAGAEYIAIPTGKTVESYNPQGDSEGNAVFYEKIVPKNLRNLLQKIDKQSPSPQRVETLDTPGKGAAGDGFSLFQITDAVRAEVMDKGQPLFALAALRNGAKLIDEIGPSDPHPAGGVIAFHGTGARFIEDGGKFDVSRSADFAMHFGTREQANARMGFESPVFYGLADGERVIPVVLDLKNVVTLPDMQSWPVMETAKELESRVPALAGLTAEIQASNVTTRADADDILRQRLAVAGIDGIRYQNSVEGAGWSYMVWETGKVRSALSNVELMRLTGEAPQFSPQARARRKEITDAIGAEIKRMLPPNVAVKLADRVTKSIDGYTAEGYGAVTPENGGRFLMEIALRFGSEKALSTGRHETIHVLREMDLIEDAEWQLLLEEASRQGIGETVSLIDGMDAAAANEQYRTLYKANGISEGLTGKALENYIVEYVNQEKVARLAEMWETRPKTFDSKVQALFERIKSLIEAIANALRGLGFQNVNDVFESVFSGAVAARARIMPQLDPLPPGVHALGASVPPVPGFVLPGLSGVIYEDAMSHQAMMAIRAFHGSPHDFDRFDMSRIGTGEGAQAYGHGLYFAERDGVARSYREKLTSPPDFVPHSINKLRHADAAVEVLQAVRRFRQEDPAYTVSELRDAVRDLTAIDKLPPYSVEAFNELLKAGHIVNPGRIYEVRINAEPDDFLEWGLPAKEQSAAVRAKLPPEWQNDLVPEYPTWMGYARTPEGAAKLREAGILGTKYLDQGSRAAGEGSRNYVVFDDSLVEIVAKDGKLVSREVKEAIREAASGENGRSMMSFAGVLAKTADHDALSIAKQMEADGKSRDDIWAETGWFRGVDGKWRFEIDDSVAYTRSATDPKTVGDALHHPSLYAAYPKTDAVKFRPEYGGGGEYYHGNVFVGPRMTAGPWDTSTMLHEGQHRIQALEGFTSGSNTAGEAVRARYGEGLLGKGRLLVDLVKNRGSIDVDGDAASAAISAYKRNAGEVEARTVEKRMGLTADERRSRPPWLDYDVPEDQQIVRLASGGPMMSLASGDNLEIRDKIENMKAAQKALESLSINGRRALTPEYDVITWPSNGRATYYVVPKGEPLEDSRGDIMWIGRFDVKPAQRMEVAGVEVTNASVVSTHQRKGIASAVYDLVAKDMAGVGGLSPSPRDQLSPDGEALWRRRLGHSMFSLAAPLDQSPEARKARAEAMGFDTSAVWYHGTRQKFDAFDETRGGGGIWLTLNKEQAEAFGDPGGYYIRAGRFGNMMDYLRARQVAVAAGTEPGTPQFAQVMIADLKAKGFDGIRDPKFKGAGGVGEDVVMLLDPSNIRSVNAEFDPAKGDSSNLMFALAPNDPPKIKALSDIIADLKEALGMPATQGRTMITAVEPSTGRKWSWRPQRNVRAQYDSAGAIARVKTVTDIEGLAHEGGHHIERLFQGRNGSPLDQLKQDHADALRGFTAGVATTPENELSEGFAEFFRSYLLDPQKTRTQAPRLVEAFDDLLDGEMPAVLELLDRAQLITTSEDYQRYINASTTERATADLVSNADRSWSKWMQDIYDQMQQGDTISGWAHQVYSSVIDGKHPFYLMTRELLRRADLNQATGGDGRGITLAVHENPYKLIRSVGDAFKTGLRWIQDGIPNYRQFGTDDSFRSTSLHEALMTALGNKWTHAGLQRFGAYLESRRAVEEWRAYEEKLVEIERMSRDITGINAISSDLRDERRRLASQLETRQRRQTEDEAVERAYFREVAKLEAQQVRIESEIANGFSTPDQRKKAEDKLKLVRRSLADYNGRLDGLAERLGRIDAERETAEQSIEGIDRALQSMGTRLEQLRTDRQRRKENGAQRAPHRISRVEHEQRIKDFEASDPAFVQAAPMVYDFLWQQAVHDFQAGRLTQAELDYRETRKHFYVPFARDMSDIVTGTAGQGSAGQRFAKDKKFTGSSRNVVNPIETIVEQTFHKAASTHFNEAMIALANLTDQVGPGGAAIAERVTKQQALDANPDAFDTLRKAIVAEGFTEEDADEMVKRVESDFGDTQLLLQWSPEGLGPKRPLLIPIWESGQRNFIRINDPELAQSVHEAVNSVGREVSNIILRALAKPAQLLRIGATQHPAFIGFNMIRDMWMAFTLTGNILDPRTYPVVTQARGLWHELRQTEFARMYQETAGLMGGQNVAALGMVKDKKAVLELRERGLHLKPIPLAIGAGLGAVTGAALLAPAGLAALGGVAAAAVGTAGGTFGAVLGAALSRGPSRFFETMAMVADLSETATRLGVASHAYQLALKNNPSLTPYQAAQEAGYVARDVIDFGRHGSKALVATRLIAFFNAQVQGLDKAVRAIMARSDRGYLIDPAKGLAAPAAAGAAAGMAVAGPVGAAVGAFAGPALASNIVARNETVRALLVPMTKKVGNLQMSKDEEAALGDSARMWAGLMLYTGALLALAALYRDDEEYQAIDAQLKQKSQPVKLFGDWYVIPKAFEMGLPSTIIEAAIDAQYAKDTRFWERTRAAIADTLTPPLVPQSVELFRGLTANYDSFRQRPIVSENMQKLHPDQQFNAYTSALARKTAQSFNAAVRQSFPEDMARKYQVSPMMVDFSIRSTLGYWGKDAQKASSLNSDVGGRSGRLAEYPMIGTVVSRFQLDPYRRSDAVNEYWQQMGAINAPFQRAAAGYDNDIRRLGEPEANRKLVMLNEEQRAFALLEGQKSNSNKRFHPLNRVKAIMEVASAMERELVEEKLMNTENRVEPTTMVVGGEKAARLREVFGQIKAMEAHNAFVVMKHNQFAARKEMDAKGTYALLRSIDKDVADELERRMGRAHRAFSGKTMAIVDYEDMKAQWPDMKKDLLQEWENAVRTADRVAGGRTRRAK